MGSFISRFFTINYVTRSASYRYQWLSLDLPEGRRSFEETKHGQYLSPEQQMERQETNRELYEAISKLSDVLQTPVVLHFVVGLQYPEIAGILDQSINTVKSIGVDLVQEVFLQTWRTLPQLREPSHFQSWLYRIAASLVSTYQKRFGHHNPTNVAEQASEAELLRAALAEVSATYRACLILYVIEELPVNQVAGILHIKEASVSKYVSRGKEELRQIYQRFLTERDNKNIPGNK